MDTRRASAPILSIIIVTWNAKRYALECLEWLSDSARVCPSEIIVVDNASKDGTPEAIAEQFPNVILIRNQDNLGFAKANNIGIARSSGRYVCLLNSDVVVPVGCMEKMVDYLEKHPDIGLLGPRMISPDGSIGQSVMRLPTVWNTICSALGLHLLFPSSKMLGGFLMEDYAYDSVDDVEVLTGWFWMLPRTALENVGGLDEQFFMYGEDIDWSHRFLKAGWRVVFYPHAEALHYGAASSAEAPTRFYIEMHRANLQYFRKHHSWPGTLGYIAATLIHELVRVVGYSIVSCFDKGQRSVALFKVSRSASCLKWLFGMGPVPQ